METDCKNKIDFLENLPVRNRKSFTKTISENSSTSTRVVNDSLKNRLNQLNLFYRANQLG